MMLNHASSKRAKFNRAELADIARGAKVNKRVKADPVIALVKRADRALDAYTTALNAHYIALEKLDEDGRGWPYVGVPDELLNVEWQRHFLFSSERHIEQQFRSALKRARQRIREGKATIKAMKPGHGAQQIILELRQRIAGDERRLAVLPKYIEPLKKQHRRRARHLKKVQAAAGLLIARKQKRKAWMVLRNLTEKIAEQKPISAEGALALIGYVELRSWCEKAELFSDEGDMPGSFGLLLRRSLAVLTKGPQA